MKKCYAFLLLLILVLTSKPVKAQVPWTRQRDSLLRLIKNHPAEDSTRANLLNTIGYLYNRTIPDSSIYYYELQKQILAKINYPRGMVLYYKNMGNAMTSKSKFNESVDYINKGIILAKKMKLTGLLTTLYNNISAVYNSMGAYSKSIGWGLKGLDLAERNHDTINIARLYANLTNTYRAVNQYQKAYLFSSKCVELSRKKHYYDLEIAGLTNMAGVLLDLKKYDTVIIVAKSELKLCENLKDNIDRVKVLLLLCGVYDHFDNYTLLKPCALQSVSLGEPLQLYAQVSLGYLYLGDCALYSRDFKSTKKYALAALATAKKGQGVFDYYAIYNQLGLAELGLGNMKQYLIYNDSMASVGQKSMLSTLAKNTQELDTKYGVEKKEQQIKLQAADLRTKQLWNTSLVIAVILLILISLLGYRVYRNRQKFLLTKYELQQQEIQTLEKEKQLSSAEALVEGQEAERSRLAKDLHDGLGGILTGTKYSLSSMQQNMIISPENAAAFEKTMGMLDRSITELRRVAHNMMPESLLKLNLDEALQDYCDEVSQSGVLKVIYQNFGLKGLRISDSVKINTYRIIQELVNNTLKHAAATEAIIQLTYKDSILGITVEDNGRGLDVAQLDKAEGIGHQNIKSRIEFLRGQIDVQSIPGSGTSVLIKIPLLT